MDVLVVVVRWLIMMLLLLLWWVREKSGVRIALLPPFFFGFCFSHHGVERGRWRGRRWRGRGRRSRSRTTSVPPFPTFLPLFLLFLLRRKLKFNSRAKTHLREWKRPFSTFSWSSDVGKEAEAQSEAGAEAATATPSGPNSAFAAAGVPHPRNKEENGEKNDFSARRNVSIWTFYPFSPTFCPFFPKKGTTSMRMTKDFYFFFSGYEWKMYYSARYL